MAGFIKMTKETWKFYLTVFAIVLFLVMNNTVLICRENNSVYGGKMFRYSMDEDSAREFTKKNDISFGKNLTEVYVDKVDNYEWLGYIATIMILIVILMAKQFVFIDQRTKEFQISLPVKQLTQVMHDYLFILGILFLGEGIQGGFFLAYQTCYNRKVLETAKMFSISEVNGGMITEANERLLAYMGMYFLFLLIAYTWIYLWMFLTKNPIIGVVAAIGIWWCTYLLLDVIIWNCISEMYAGGNWNPMADCMEWIASMLSPFGFFNRNSLGDGLHSVGQTAIVMLIFWLVMLVLIVIAGLKRELTKGKLFYFPILDYPIAFILGMGIMIYISENFGVLENIVVVAGVILSIVIFILIHPFSVKQSRVWEVQ